MRGTNDSSMKGSRLQTSNIATILSKERKEKRNERVLTSHTTLATRTAGTRDPRHAQQEIVLEIRVTGTAGCTLGTFEMRDGGGHVKKKKSTLDLRTDALPCVVMVDELGLHRPPRYITIAGNAKGNADAATL